ncbi:hypothetical protein EXW96_02190 [Paenibacillus sp. JMULE4]|uniref:hypothetical protein n=1 Tax=Paenibacillus sp. JMULE4 TaxID=2518342 RepID=UPI0015759CAB|nr:hypothetical protein [Paenibacillus sp. JMULE4]NTZ16424.1 hypothetical protein [Paenibacillus sp. JMULE4]
MPRLSEIDGNDTTQICLFLKFATEKWHLESLQSGKLRMNNLRKFIDMEKNEGKKGMGDLLEASNVINLLNFKLVDPDTDEIIFEGKASKGIMTLNHCTTKLVFCLTMVDSKMLEVVGDDDTSYKCKVIFSEIQKQRFVEDFGNYVMILPVSAFRVCQEFCVNSVMPKFGAGLDMEPPVGMISRDWAMLESGHHVANQPIMPTPPCKVL